MKNNPEKKIPSCCHQHRGNKFAFKQNLKHYCRKLLGMKQDSSQDTMNQENDVFCHALKMKGHCNKKFFDPSLKKLDDFAEGTKVIVKKIAAGRRLKMNLSAMGININDEIQILSNNSGQCVIIVGDKRFSLCPEIASLILVELV